MSFCQECLGSNATCTRSIAYALRIPHVLSTLHPPPVIGAAGYPAFSTTLLFFGSEADGELNLDCIHKVAILWIGGRSILLILILHPSFRPLPVAQLSRQIAEQINSTSAIVAVGYK
ncbi:hypothetical protein OPQ81_010830 [Rhizoctonia solani]|nr:hypothetical protein OPQ81_010830 [Rhizoctonia solani]